MIDEDDLQLISIAETKDADSPAFESLITRCKSLSARSQIKQILYNKWKQYKSRHNNDR